MEEYLLLHLRKKAIPMRFSGIALSVRLKILMMISMCMKKEKIHYLLSLRNKIDIRSKTGAFCFYSGIDLKVSNIWEMEDLYPHRSGGVDLIVNLFPAWIYFNERKWSKNPDDFILELWTCDENITKFLRGFLIQHRDKSLSYLTNRPYEKGICDYWYETKQRELFEFNNHSQ